MVKSGYFPSKKYTSIIFMKIFYLLAIFAVACSCEVKDDHSFLVPLETVYETQRMGFSVLFPISDLGDETLQRLVFPEMTNCEDTTFTTIYFTGKNENALENEVLVLVGNYGNPSPKLWVDYNNTLDFSTQASPLIFSDSLLDISISNLSETGGSHTVRLNKPSQNQLSKDLPIVTKYLSRGRPVVGFWYEKRRNIFVGDFVYKTDSMRIGIMDSNVDGMFNDIGSDRLVVGEYKGAISGTEEAEGAIVLDSTTFFQSTNYAFEVVSISPEGKFLTIKPTLSSNVKSRLKEGDLLPEYELTSVLGESVALSEFYKTDKLLYLSFWATWCGGCIEEIPDLKSLEQQYKDKIDIIGINYNQSLPIITKFIEKHTISWPNFLPNESLNGDLLVHGLPRNVLIDGNGIIIDMNIHPKDVITHLEDGNSVQE